MLASLGIFLSTNSAVGALVTVSNVNATSNGGAALMDSSGALLADPPGRIFIGGFSTFSTAGAIGTAFTSNFAALAADFVSIGDVAVEEDAVGAMGASVLGIHDSSSSGLDPTTVLGRNVAVWITTSGTVNDTGAEHLIFLTSQTYIADMAPPANEESYSVLLRDGSGSLAVGEFGNFSNDFTFGAGSELAFNTVAVPEPSTITLLSALFLTGIFAMRMRLRSRAEAQSG